MTEGEARNLVLRDLAPKATLRSPFQGPPNIESAKRRLAESLPPELAEWLPHAPGAQPVAAAARFIGFEGLARWSMPGDWIAKRWFPVADDACGDYFVLIEHSPARRVVVFWDHECNELDEYDYVCASSLWHFLAGSLREPPGGGWPLDRETTIAFDPDMALLDGVPFGWSS